MKYGVFLVGALSLLTLNVLNVLALSAPLNDSIKLADNINEPETISISGSIEELNHEELSNLSDTIFIGKVKEILPGRWNTIDGKEPATDVEIDPFDLIYTDIIISVDKYLKNPLSSKEVIVRVVGGTIGNVSMEAEFEPSFKNGENVLLFLTKDTNPGTKDLRPDHFVVTGLMMGKFTLTNDGKAIRPDENTTLDELLSTINQTDNKTNDAGMLDKTGTPGKQEENPNSTPEIKSNPESKRAPFISPVWVLAAVLGAVTYVRRNK
jgi:hypothetical protein